MNNNTNTITPINLDPNQIFNKNININNITSSICFLDNEYLYDFLESNPHLANYEYILSNKANWSVKYILNKISLEEIKNNDDYIIAISLNENQKIVKFILENNIYDYEVLSGNSNDLAVNFMLNHKDKISIFNVICDNNNDKMVDYILSLNKKVLLSDINIEYFYYNFRNNNKKIIEFLDNNKVEYDKKENINKITELLCNNNEINDLLCNYNINEKVNNIINNYLFAKNNIYKQ